jgi:hypothetical protein
MRSGSLRELEHLRTALADLNVIVHLNRKYGSQN